MGAELVWYGLAAVALGLAIGVAMGAALGRRASARRRPMTVTAASPVAGVEPTRALVPYLVVDGGHEAIEWYREVFGAEEVSRMTGGAGRVAHAELRIGGSTIYLGDEHPHLEEIVAPTRIGGTPVYLSLETDDVPGLFERAIRTGADAIRQPTDPSLPLQTAKVRDPFGHIWLLTRAP